MGSLIMTADDVAWRIEERSGIRFSISRNPRESVSGIGFHWKDLLRVRRRKAALWKNERGQLESSANRDPAHRTRSMTQRRHGPHIRPGVPSPCATETNHPHMFVGLPSILQEKPADNPTNSRDLERMEDRGPRLF